MKQFTVDFTKQGESSFLALGKNIRNKIEKKLRFFIDQKNPLQYCKKLHGAENLYRFRIGDYRVIFSIQEKGLIVVLLVLKVDHRSKIYDRLDSI